MDALTGRQQLTLGNRLELLFSARLPSRLTGSLERIEKVAQDYKIIGVNDRA
jgi:hypothetical protein